MILGSGACFVVVESREHAAARGAKPLATLAGIASDRRRRRPGGVEEALHALSQQLNAHPDVVISGATGIRGITDEEQAALKDIAPGAPVHATGDLVGHTMEAQAATGVALAAGLIAQGKAGEALVTSVGHWRGEGAIRLTKA